MMASVLDKIDRLLGGRQGQAWSGSIEDLLYDGERVDRRVDIDDNEVVVTSHRVLAFTPESPGENFHQLDRPNVTDVRIGGEGEDDLLYRGVRTSIYAVLLIGIGLVIDFESILPVSNISTSGAGRIGVGGMIGTMNRFLGLIGQLDELMVTFGALALFLAAVFFGVYVVTRDRVLVIDVAGEAENVHVPITKERAESAVAELEAVLFDVPGASGPGEGVDGPSEGVDGPGEGVDGPGDPDAPGVDGPGDPDAPGGPDPDVGGPAGRGPSSSGPGSTGRRNP